MKILWLFVALSLGASAQDILTNDSVLKMIKAGLSDGIVIGTIQSQAGKYSLTPDDLIKLKGQGVSDNVIAAMVAKGSGGSSGAAASGTSADADIPQGVDIGVYFKKGGKWEEMLPEVGGVIKSIASAGIVKGDVNGHIAGSHSRNSAASPLEVLIYATEGVAITEYQLIHLHEERIRGSSEPSRVESCTFREAQLGMSFHLRARKSPIECTRCCCRVSERASMAFCRQEP